MSRRNKQRTEVAAGADGVSVWLCVLVALYVARLLVPEDPGHREGYDAPLTMLWLLAAVAWVCWHVRKHTLAVRFGWPDGFVVALAGWHTLSGVGASLTGAPRPALNATTSWLAVTISYLLARQWVRTPLSARCLCSVMVGAAVGLSALAIYQRAVAIPADQASYERHKNDTLALYQQSGQWMPAGSSIREQFENRLYAAQPSAAFALTNTLAGFLVPWTVLLAGLWMLHHYHSAFVAPLRWSALTALHLRWAGLIVLPLIAVVLTGSRTALVSISAACFIAAFCAVPWQSLSRGWRTAIIGLLVACGLSVPVLHVACQAAGSRTYERLVRATLESWQFRLEYWQATAQLILDHPCLGVGPGQFQDAYTAYKLPAASEEIQDPHNWVMELASTAGLPALAAFGLLLATVAWRFARSTTCASSAKSPVGSTKSVVSAVVGIGLGAALAWLTGYPAGRPTVLCLVGGMVAGWLLMLPWTRAGKFPRWLAGIAASALLLNLLAAGALAYPCLAESLLLVIAVTLNVSDRGPARAIGAVGGWSLGLALGAGLVVAMVTVYQPVLRARIELSGADAAMAVGQFDQERLRLEAACRADPWSALAHRRLAARRLADYQQQSQASVLQLFELANDNAIALAPERSTLWSQSGAWYATLYDMTGVDAHLDRARADLHRAIALYPHRAALYAELARVLWRAKDTPAGNEAARRAIELDDIQRAAGHTDRALDDSIRNELLQGLTSN